MLTVNTTNILSFDILELNIMFLLHASVVQDHHQAVNIGIRLVIEVPIWIYTSATCRIVH
jgi:hypothetical protein